MNEFLKNINNSPIIIIAGPTASGKSEFAIDLAKEVSGTIINFDSMQVYKELKILSARPNRHYCKIIPHKLYGFLDADFPCSALYWRDMALIKIKESLFKGRIPILVGGTGLYIKSLLDGIDGVPKSLPEYRIKAEKIFKEEFPQFSNNIMVVIDAKKSDVAKDIASKMYSEIKKQEGKLFTDIFYPNELDFFKKNGLLYLSEEELEKWLDQIVNYQPFISRLSKDQTLYGLLNTINFFLSNSRLHK